MQKAHLQHQKQEANKSFRVSGTSLPGEETDQAVEKGIKQEVLARYQDHLVMALSPAPAPKQGHLIHWTKLHTPALLLGVKWHRRSRHWAWYQLVQPLPSLSSKQGH